MGIIIILNLILQSTVMQYIRIYDVLPNTALILVISFAIYNGKNKGAIIGFIIGVLQDIVFARIVGLNTLLYMLTGYLVGATNQKIFKDNLIIPFIMTALATTFYESINMLFIYLLGYRIELFNVFKKMLVVEVLYNSIMSVFIYIYVSKLYKSKTMKRRY